MAPRLEFGYFGMGLVIVEGDHIIAENRPEGVGDESANSSAMEEAPNMLVAVCVTP